MEEHETVRMSGTEMDICREENTAYEYLCRLEEARVWIQDCIIEELPPPTELEEVLRNGVYLAKLANFIDPGTVPLNKIYDADQDIYRTKGLQFRHTDNINYWLTSMENLDFAKTVYPDTFDVYDKRNMPKVVYCIHALSIYLHKKGKAPEINNFYGKITFTNEEMILIQKELDKYGIQMPLFGKIAGMLMPDVPAESAVLHAIIIAINDAIENKDANLMVLLRNPDAGINELDSAKEGPYREELFLSKLLKTQKALDQSLSGSYIPDAYDELLTQNEIQQSIDAVNMSELSYEIIEAVESQNTAELLKALQNPCLAVSDVFSMLSENYLTGLKEAFAMEGENNNNLQLSKSKINSVIQKCNLEFSETNEKAAFVTSIKEAIEKSDSKALTAALKILKEKVPKVPAIQTPHQKELFMQGLIHIQQESKHSLEYDEICQSIHLLSDVLKINQSLESNNEEAFCIILKNAALYIDHIFLENKHNYFQALKKFKTVGYLTLKEIICCIRQTNQELELQKQEQAVQDIIRAVKRRNSKETLRSLMNPFARLICVEAAQAELYLECLWKILSIGLNRENIQDCVNMANKLVLTASSICSSVAALNMTVLKESPLAVQKALESPDLEINHLILACVSSYHQQLKNARSLRMGNITNDEEDSASWVRVTLPQTHTKYYLNLRTLETSWTTPEDYMCEGLFLSKEDIQEIVSKVNKSYELTFLRSRLLHITELQAYARGFLLRKAFRYSLPKRTSSQEILIVNAAAVKIQSYVRMWLARRRFVKQKWTFILNESSARRIQNWWRKCNHTKTLKSSNPTIEAVSSFISALDVSDDDYKEELDLHDVRGKVVQMIRHNKELEINVNNMDLKIGLIVRNGLTAQELFGQNKKNSLNRSISSKMSEEPLEQANIQNRLSSILLVHNKESQILLEAYQHLFHLLQTDPRYMARLINSMSPGQSNKFTNSVIYALYNYASTPREECLMLQLFGYALKEEIRKVDKLADVSTGATLVFKMILYFNKTGRGYSCLKELLQPVIEMILNDESLFFSMDPVEVYRHWVNEQESKTGVNVQMPYTLSAEEAENVPEVAERLKKSLKMLEEKALIFVNRILTSVHLLPYGIRYVAKVLYNCLESKFPQANETEIMKHVGHFLYYRYIIAAIPAADSFGIVTLRPGKSIQPIQRSNLGAIAKVLHHAAAFQVFEPSNKFSVLNSCLVKCHKQLLNFLKVACSVEEPEVCFNMDAYTEATLFTKPQISLTLQEIYTTHELLCKHRETVAVDSDDHLHELLLDLGPPSALEERTRKDLIVLSLTNKFTAQAAEIPALDKLFATTKQMVIQLLQCQNKGSTLLDVLRTAASKEEQRCFLELSQTSTSVDLLAQFKDIAEFKDRILHQLVQLELAGYVNSKDGYQTVINFIAKNIVNRKSYRERRKDEIEKLERTLVQLQAKRDYFDDILKYYDEYIKNCLQSLTKKHKTDIKRKVVKRTGDKLVESGILLAVDGLENSQLKHVTFEISSTDIVGVFSIKVNFMYATFANVDLDIQQLLKHQYEGDNIIELFGRAKINVNLFIYLLNRKFLSMFS